MKKDTQRTLQQNKALYKWFEAVAEKLNDAGITPEVFANLGIEIRWTKEMVKNNIWKKVQKEKFGTDSTKELTIGDLQEIYEDIDKNLLENPLVSIDVPFPNMRDKIQEDLYGK